MFARSESVKLLIGVLGIQCNGNITASVLLKRRWTWTQIATRRLNTPSMKIDCHNVRVHKSSELNTE